MKRLEGVDATFLYTETERSPGTIGACLLLADGGEEIFDRLVRRLTAETATDVLFRRRIQRVPLDLHHPVWVEDPDFDVRRHVERRQVGSGGLTAALGDLFAQPLDRDLPLWHVTWIEGLDEEVDGGRSAIVIRTHHAAVDGVGGIGLLTSLLDLEPNPPEKPADREAQGMASGEDGVVGEVGENGEGSGSSASSPGPAGALGLIVDAGLDLAKDPLRPARTAWGLIRDLAASLDPAERRASEVLGASIAPPTPFNVGLCGERSIRLLSLDLTAIHAARAEEGVTVNDFVLALVSGGLRRYLELVGALPDDPLVCYLPMTTGAEAEGNHTTVIPVQLPTHEPDARRRVALTAAAAASAKGRASGRHTPLILDLSALTGPALGAVMERMAVAMGVTQRLRLAGNVVVSNVARLPFTVYASGSPVVGFFPIGIITDGSGLNVTYLSYEDRLQVSILADARALPDPELLVAAVEGEWAHLQTELIPSE